MESIDLDAPDDPPLLHQARFQANLRGRLVGDRSFNATAIGRALLGEQLLGVEEDPDSANRQIARLKGDLYLETTVTGRCTGPRASGCSAARRSARPRAFGDGCDPRRLGQQHH